MLGWFKKRFAQRSSLQNPEDLSAAELKLLGEDLKNLPSELSERAFRYVVEGVDEAVLSGVAELDDAAVKLGVCACRIPWTARRAEGRQRLLASGCANKPRFLLRLCRVLQAASPSRGLRSSFPMLSEEAPWLQILFHEVYDPRNTLKCPTLRFSTVEKMLELSGVSNRLLQRVLLLTPGTVRFFPGLLKMQGLAQATAGCPDLIKEALAAKSVEDRIAVLELMGDLRVEIGSHQDQVLDMALGNSKKVRLAASALLGSNPSSDLGLLIRAACSQGSPSRRAQAVRFLHASQGEQAAEFLEQLQAERPPKVVAQALNEVLSAKLETAPERPSEVKLEPLDSSAPSPELKPLLKRLAEAAQEKAGHRVFGDGELFLALSEFHSHSRPERVLGLAWYQPVRAPLEELLKHPDLTLLQAVRLMLLSRALVYRERTESWAMDHWFGNQMVVYAKGREPRVTLEHVEQALAELGFGEDFLGGRRFQYWTCQGWSPEDVWPYFARRPHLLEADLNHEYGENNNRALQTLAEFEVIPSQFRERCWELALGSAKGNRELAQVCVSKQPGFEERVRLGLSHGRQSVRTAAAQWLARIPEESTVSALRKAARKEKTEVAKAAMLASLQTLGQDLEEFFALEPLLAEARKGLKKGRPAALAWFAWEDLPVVHWAEDAAMVDKIILEWFLVRAHKLKDPAPGPLLRQYCQRFQQQDARELGLFVLKAFLAEDAQPHSAIKHKGILALVGACAGSEVVGYLGPYFKKWYGLRAHQCKAFLHTLAAIDDPHCLQLVLSIANRFRTKGIQREAEQLVGAIAERKGWTRDQLEDRTVPTAGMDESGVLTLDLGARELEARLDSRLKFELTDQGQILKSFPAARKSDDAALVNLAKKRFGTCKKELVSVLKLQKTRLYEAMCVQREWSTTDWQSYLADHPILSRLCQQLLWTNQGRVFRLMDDGSLTDHQHNLLELDNRDGVRLAHSLHLNSDQIEPWLEHFDDFEILPLFPQIGGQVYRLPTELGSALELLDFQGYVTDSFRLRNALKKAGFTRGPAEDGGCFYSYSRLFSGIGLEAVLAFSGARLPEEEQPVVLHELTFTQQRRLELGEVSPVLLAECWNTVNAIAQEGSGYDPDWKTKYRP